MLMTSAVCSFMLIHELGRSPRKNHMGKFIEEVKLFTDGGCRGNPGPGAIGVLITDENGEQLHTYKQCIGHTTNNRAEYNTLIKGLDLCAKYTRKRVTCFMDSELVVKQMNGVNRLKNDVLRDLYHKVRRCQEVFTSVTYQHVRRSNPFIKIVDRMVNDAFEGR